jgi:AcrR family transcriptional regulator
MQLAPPPHLPSHADIRSAGILESVRQAFLDKGFDGASMQDLARAAGMSVGNFYRYFPSKAAIIQALILHDAETVQRDFAAILTSPQPMATLRQVIHARISDNECANDLALWTEVEAASRRSPEIALAAQRMETEVQGNFLAVFAAELGLTIEEAKRRFSAPASYVLVMVKAASCLSCAAPLDQSAVRSMILRSVDQVLDEVASSARPAAGPANSILTSPLQTSPASVQPKDQTCV